MFDRVINSPSIMANLAKAIISAVLITAFIALIIYASISSISTANAATTACPIGQYTYNAVITDVYDGDTVTANVDLGFSTWKHGEKLRLHGINAPEMRGDEKPQGTLSRDWLRSAILNSGVIIQTIKDKKLMLKSNLTRRR